VTLLKLLSHEAKQIGHINVCCSVYSLAVLCGMATEQVPTDTNSDHSALIIPNSGVGNNYFCPAL
ncbi:MAG: hypothetical protein K2J07_00390, partial [Muribaculaceae bacterium]|nr:hypothetical protein [Muribaculaceae bacterium]